MQQLGFVFVVVVVGYSRDFETSPVSLPIFMASRTILTATSQGTDGTTEMTSLVLQRAILHPSKTTAKGGAKVVQEALSTSHCTPGYIILLEIFDDGEYLLIFYGAGWYQ